MFRKSITRQILVYLQLFSCIISRVSRGVYGLYQSIYNLILSRMYSLEMSQNDQRVVQVKRDLAPELQYE